MKNRLAWILTFVLFAQGLLTYPLPVSADEPLLVEEALTIEYGEDGFPVVRGLEIELPAEEQNAVQESVREEDAGEENVEEELSDSMQLFSVRPQVEVVGEADASYYLSPMLSGVRNQNPYNTCWAYATMTASEMATMLKTGDGTTPVDYSEKQIIYGLFHGPEDTLLADNYLDAQAVPYSAAGALVNWIGYGLQSSYPYDDTALTDVQLRDDVAHLKAAYFLDDWPAKGAKKQDGTQLYADEEAWSTACETVNQRIKAAVKAHGAVTATISTRSSYNSSSKTYYTAWPGDGKKVSPTHMITIVGWDDAKDWDGDQIPDGAFIIQNSYGTGFGENGLAYVAYGDASLANPIAYEVELADASGALKSEVVFSHTDVGWNGTDRINGGQSAFEGRNLFVSDRDVRLTQLGFRKEGAGEYELTLRTGVEAGNALSGTVVAEKAGSTTSGGYYIVDLDTPIDIQAGDYFSVNCLQSSEGNHFLCFEGGDAYDASGTKVLQTSCQPGESFVIYGTTASDCATSTNAFGQNLTLRRNLCIYAYGSITEEKLTVPNVINQTKDAATTALAEAGFSNVKVTETYHDSVAAGKVISISPAEGSQQYADAEITLTVSKGIKAPTITSGKVYMIIPKSAPKLALQSASMLNGAQIQTATKNADSEAQKFIFKENKDGSWRLVSQQCDLSVDAARGSTANKAKLQLYNENNTASEKWKIKINSDGTVTFLNAKTGKAFDVPGNSTKAGAKMQMYTANGTDAQRFYLEETKAMAHTYTGTYTLRAAAKQNFALDVKGASKANGGNVQIYKYNGTNAQKFKLLYSGNGYYRLVNVNSGRVVDIKAGKSASGTNVQQYTWNGSKAQRWKLIKNKDGSFVLQSALGTVLDISGGKYVNGKNVWAYKKNGTKAQNWVLKKL